MQSRIKKYEANQTTRLSHDETKFTCLLVQRFIISVAELKGFWRTRQKKVSIEQRKTDKLRM